MVRDFGAAELVFDDAHLLDRFDLGDDQAFEPRTHHRLDVLDEALEPTAFTRT